MARCLIIGCGCRGQKLAAELRSHGHAVRGTTRAPERLEALEAAGIDGFQADPDRVATLVPAFEHVSVACVLLGSAEGRPAAVEALHGERLEMLLTKMLDTTIRGIVYEAAGSAGTAVLHSGALRVQRACERSLIPYETVRCDPRSRGVGTWLSETLSAVLRLLGDREAPAASA